jgi:hypothetical protein
MLLQNYPSNGLSQEETEDPFLVFHDLFSTYHLPDIRQQLWKLLKTTVTGNYCRDLNRRERSDLLFFYEQLERLIEAAHLLHQREARE